MSRRPVEIDVPASTSNLGGGFDCVGVAIDRWLRVRISESLDGRTVVRRSGTLESLDAVLPSPSADWLVRGFLAAAARAGAGKFDSLKLCIEAHSEIPVGRGLGSSAAALIAGVRAASAWLDLDLADAEVIDIAAAMEGHADNAGAAALGGAVLVVPSAAGSLARPLEIHDEVRLVFAVPEFALETRRARAVLPEFVPHGTAVAAVARAASLIGGLADGDPERLAAGLDDVLHVPFRKRLIPGYTEVTRAARAAGAVGATLSGSGSSIVAVVMGSAAVPAVAEAMRAAWAAAGFTAETFEPSIVKETVCR